MQSTINCIIFLTLLFGLTIQQAGFSNEPVPQSSKATAVISESVKEAEMPEEPVSNMISNGNFADGMDNWYFWQWNTGNGSGSVENGVFHARIQNGGVNSWDVIFQQYDLTIVNGHTYTATFDAYAASSRGIKVFVGQSSEPYTNYNSNFSFSLSTSRHTYSFTFTMNSPTDNLATLRFDLGASNADVYLDNITLLETGLFEESLSNPNIQPSGDAQSAYRLISVPLELENTSMSDAFIDDLGPADKSQWRLFQRENGSWSEYSDNMQVVPGESYFLIVKNSDIQLDVGSGYLIRDASYDIPLEQGWNCIANPYDFNLSDTEISNENGEAVTLWDYTGAWHITHDFNSWEGYAVYSESGKNITITPDWYSSINKKNFENFTDCAEWSLQIEAICENAADPTNFCGIIRDSYDQTDCYYLHEPPPIGQYVSLYFQNLENEKPFSQFAAAFSPQKEKFYSWDMVVETNIPNKNVLLKFKQFRNLPNDYKVILRDKTTHQYQEIPSTGTTCFISGDSLTQREFELIVGDVQVFDDLSTKPISFHLEQNYPNPFNFETTIGFEIKKQILVNLNIYDIKGQHIKTLVNRIQDQGKHTIAWNASNLPSGIYLYCLKAGDYIQTRKLILQK